MLIEMFKFRTKSVPTLTIFCDFFYCISLWHDNLNLYNNPYIIKI
jgi:hypothetical protein